MLDVNLGGVLNLARAAVPALLRRPEPRDRPLPRRRLGGGDPRPADARRLLRGQGRRHRPGARAGGRARRHRRHGQRGESRARPRTRDPRRERAALRAGRRRGVRSRSSRSAACSSPTRSPRCSPSSPGRPEQRITGAVVPVDGGLSTVTSADADRVPAASSTRRPGSSTTRMWFGGSPARVVRLTEAGRARVGGAAGAPVSSTRAPGRSPGGSPTPVSRIPCRLPGRPPRSPSSFPVHDRARRPRTAAWPRVGTAHRVVVVDDGSTDADRIARSCTDHGATAGAARRQRRPGSGAQHRARARRHAVRRVPRQRLRAAAAAGSSRCSRTSPTRWSLPSRRGSSRSAGDTLGRALRPRAEQPRPRRPARAGGAPHAGSPYVPTAALVVRQLRARQPRSGLRRVAACRRGRRPGLAAASGGRADPLRPVGRGAAPASRSAGPRCWPGGSGTAPRRHRSRAGIPVPLTPLVLHPWPTLAVAAGAGPSPGARRRSSGGPVRRRRRAPCARQTSRPRVCCRRPRARCSRPSSGSAAT